MVVGEVERDLGFECVVVRELWVVWVLRVCFLFLLEIEGNGLGSRCEGFS